MRSLGEILFRLRQEFANVWLYRSPPEWGEPLAGPLPGLPDPLAVAAAIRVDPAAAEYRTSLETLAEEILAHRFRLLGLEVADLGTRIRWRRDFVHGKESGLTYFRRIPYLDFTSVGDHKVIWELNRHQHLVVLAQAYLLTGRREFLDEIPRQLDAWMQENPVQRGMNWTSALEVAFRALSWIWVLHLVGDQLPEEFRRRWMRSLLHHGAHLEYNLSFYFSPNTHLLGEAVALHALGRLLPRMPGAERWRKLGGRTVVEQMQQQVREDGSHFEQSSYYHLYALDLFLLHFLLDPETPSWYRGRLIAMAEFLHALVSRKGLLPLIGDEDGGRLFHPYGVRQRFAEGTLATCASLFQRNEWVRDPQAVQQQAMWWLGPDAAPLAVSSAPSQSRWFPDAGLAVMQSDRVHLIFDSGPFGAGSAGHSHADTLSLLAFRGGEEVLIDAGTYTYVADPQARQEYRGTAAHNTVSIDSVEQAIPQGPFRWVQPPVVELLHWTPGERYDAVDARCRYQGFTHRRSVLFRKPDVVIIVDRMAAEENEGGASGRSYQVEQRWLFAQPQDRERLHSSQACSDEPAWRSPALGSREPAWRRVVRYTGRLPGVLVTVLDLREDGLGEDGKADWDMQVQESETETVVVVLPDGAARFPLAGSPEWIQR